MIIAQDKSLTKQPPPTIVYALNIEWFQRFQNTNLFFGRTNTCSDDIRKYLTASNLISFSWLRIISCMVMSIFSATCSVVQLVLSSLTLSDVYSRRFNYKLTSESIKVPRCRLKYKAHGVGNPNQLVSVFNIDFFSIKTYYHFCFCYNLY